MLEIVQARALKPAFVKDHLVLAPGLNMVLSLRAMLHVKVKAREHEPGPVVPPAGNHAAPALA